ncbi:MAG TPA: hypothetical protein VGI45_17575 [Terracidiphilus sp.]|jgi:hypothetical protein
MVRTLALTAVIVASAFQSSPNARDDLAELRRQAHAAHQSGDKNGYLQAAIKVQKLLNNYPLAIESVARAYTEAGNSSQALASLTQFAQMDEVDKTIVDGSDKIFTPLSGSSGYKTVLDLFATNSTPISTAEAAFNLPDAGIVAEDIDYDPASKSFLITSVLQKKIIRVAPSGAAADFAQSPHHWPMLAIKVDSARHLVWATEVALDGFTAAPKADWGHSAVLCFDLSSGKLLHRVEGPAQSALGDMVLAQNGDPILSDGSGGGIYRLTHAHLSLINGTDFISPQTPAPLPDPNHVLVPDYVRGIAILDLQNGHVEWLNHDQPPTVALNGVDGLYFHRGTLLLTQNGTSPERVVRLQLDASLARILSSQIIERATPTLGDPTHGVVVGDTFYYIANSGWSELDDHGAVKPGSRLTPARIMRFEIH